MSDDGYYGGASSPYDEYDEYWDEQAGDVAGDLAEHTLHSPIYFDDPHYALTYEYSDWEYYSDDYFDEDPILLKKHPQDGGSVSKTSRGKKRKRGDNEDVPSLDLNERPALEKCIVGTTWRQPSVEPQPVFVQGDGETVALLKDWKTMLEHKDQMKRPRTALTRDESWANDMSLADMGLLGERGRQPETAGPEAVKADLEEEEEDVDQEAEDEMSDLEEEEDEGEMDVTEEQEEKQEDEPEFDTKSPPRKRARPMLPPSPPRSKDSSREDQPLIEAEDAEDQTTGSKRKRGNEPSPEHKKGQVVQLEDSIVVDKSNSSSQRKRSKRVVFSAGKEVIPSSREDKDDIQDVEPGPPPIVTPRTTRSGKRLGK